MPPGARNTGDVGLVFRPITSPGFEQYFPSATPREAEEIEANGPVNGGGIGPSNYVELPPDNAPRRNYVEARPGAQSTINLDSALANLNRSIQARTAGGKPPKPPKTGSKFNWGQLVSAVLTTPQAQNVVRDIRDSNLTRDTLEAWETAYPASSTPDRVRSYLRRNTGQGAVRRAWEGKPVPGAWAIPWWLWLLLALVVALLLAAALRR